MAVSLAVALSPEVTRADLVGGGYSVSTTTSSWLTNWPTAPQNVQPQYTSIASASLSTLSTAQAAPGIAGGATYTMLSETFTPGVAFTLTGIGVIALANAQSTVSMHLYDVTTTLSSTNFNSSAQTYSVSSLTDLFGGGSGLSYTMSNSTIHQIFFALTNGPTSNDRILLQTNHTYALEFWATAQNNFIWERNSGIPTDTGGDLMAAANAATSVTRTTIAAAGLAGGAPRIGALALYSTNYINPGATTNIATTLNNPVPAAYGPPTVWPYTAGIAMSSGTNGAGVNAQFSGSATTVMGETFFVSRSMSLRDFYYVIQGSATSGNYDLVLNDLGTNTTTVTNYGNSFNPGPFTSANLLSHPTSQFPQYWSFSPVGLTNKTIVKFKFSGADAVTLTPGHNYFLGFANVSGNNDMVLERSSGVQSYTSGAAYSGTAATVANGGFGSGPRNFLMAVDVLNPNLVVTVTNSTMASTWPTLPGLQNGGNPALQTVDDPSSIDPGISSGVWEGVQSARALSMSFTATSNFNLCAIALSQNGLGSSNCLFTIAVYDVTNTFFTQGPSGSTSKWPFNFQPNIDTSAKGVPIFNTNVDFYYTADNGANGSGQGTNSQIMILTLAGAYCPLLQSNHVYTVEISADTYGQNANNTGLFQWMRDLGQTSFQSGLLPDLGDGIQFSGYRTNAASANAAFYVIPRALNRTYTDPEQFAGQLASGPRDFVMAVYAGNPSPGSITLNSVSRSGNSVALNWTPTPAGTYSYTVWRKTTLTDLSWTSITSGISTASYTDTSATAGTGFYRVSCP